jgi:superfamily I DNA/RNA helicase
MSESWNLGVRGDQVLRLINEDSEIMRVEAGPGTGKTFGIQRRVERIMHLNGLAVKGNQVLIVAFNRVIANQLKKDIEARLRGVPHDGDPAIMTVHGICLKIVGGDLRILLDHEVEAMIYDLRQSQEIQDLYPNYSATDQALREHEAKHAEHTKLWQQAQGWLLRHHAKLMSDIPLLLLDRIAGGDFPDLGFMHVIVDEFQDLTPGEQQVLFKMRHEKGQLVALGDPRQSIYAFRGNERDGLKKLNGFGNVTEVPLTECHRCPAPIVEAANKLMGLTGPHAMTPTSPTPANLHLVTWDELKAEADGMARAIINNIRAHPDEEKHQEQHLVMVSRRQIGYSLRDSLLSIDSGLKVDLTFSESLLEDWSVREAFLFFCLLADPDHPTWRAWFGCKNSTTGSDFKAPERNADAYSKFLNSCGDTIRESDVEHLAHEAREDRRGGGGTNLWDRARRFVDLRSVFSKWNPEDASNSIRLIFDADQWSHTEDPATAKLDMQLLADRALALLEEARGRADSESREQLREVARMLRYQIATREPFATGDSTIQITTFWGAKGITADHVYILGLCAEAIPGKRRDEYPGTDADYAEEQRRLFYVSITRTRKTLVMSRALKIARGEAKRMGLAIEDGSAYQVGLTMSPFLRDVIALLPAAIRGDVWQGCSSS